MRCRTCRRRRVRVRRSARLADCPAAAASAPADCADAFRRPPAQQSRPCFSVRPGSLRGPRSQARVARSAACRARKIAQTDSRRAFASISFSRSISSRPTVTSLFGKVSCSRCARIIACAAARSAGSGSEGVVTTTIQHIRCQKSRQISVVSQKATAYPEACGRQVACGILQSIPDKR